MNALLLLLMVVIVVILVALVLGQIWRHPVAWAFAAVLIWAGVLALQHHQAAP